MAPLGGMSQVLTDYRPDGEKRAYISTPSGQLLYHLTTSAAVTTTQTDAIDGETVELQTSQATFYHYDITGSTVALSDDSGNVTGRVWYTPYGEVTKRSGTVNTRFLFCGTYGVQTDASGLKNNHPA